VSVLGGLRIAVTRPRPQGDALCGRLRALGAMPVHVATIEIAEPLELAPMDDALRSLDRYDWVVFTSANGVRSAVRRMELLGLGADRFGGVRVAAVGPATARVLSESGIAVAAIPHQYLGERIADTIGAGPGRRVLLLRADIADPLLPRLLREKGAVVEDITAYRTVRSVPDSQALAALRVGVDVITFTSPSAVRGLVHALGSDWQDTIGATLIASIGPVTSEAVRHHGLDVGIEASEHTTDGLVRALTDHYGARLGEWNRK